MREFLVPAIYVTLSTIYVRHQENQRNLDIPIRVSVMRPLQINVIYDWDDT